MQRLWFFFHGEKQKVLTKKHAEKDAHDIHPRCDEEWIQSLSENIQEFLHSTIDKNSVNEKWSSHEHMCRC